MIGSAAKVYECTFDSNMAVANSTSQATPFLGYGGAVNIQTGSSVECKTSLFVGYADVMSPATAIRTVASAKNHPGALTIGRDGCSPLTCCYNNGRLMVVEGGHEFTAVALEVRESPTTAST